jgi:hypothetical protein
MLSHKPLIVGLSGIISMVSICIFIYFFIQLGKEENRVPEKRSKIIKGLIVSGLPAFLLGSLVMLASSTYCVIY